MGVVKTVLPKSGFYNRRRKSHSSNGKGMVEKEDNSALGADSMDDYEFAEVGCELGLVEQQLCSIPYELYDLPNLREVLSLNTWNSCLTEEERFSLSAFLPDMDEQTFCLTMKELLGGNNIYFGNPVNTFFKRLKGGFYPPKVTGFREGLQFLQMRKYYHSLKSYHDNMAQMFVEMRRVWDQCDRSAGMEERIDIWRTRRKHKGDYVLDLNTVPLDGYSFSEEVKSDAVMYHLSNKMKSAEGKRPNNIFPMLPTNGIKFAAPNSGAKGVLKLKPLGNGSFEKHHPRIVFSDMLDKRHSVPKGVLKVVPKVPSIQLEQSKMMPRLRQPSPPVNSQIFQDRKFSSLPASLYFGDAGGHSELPFPLQKVSVSEAHTTLDLEEPSCTLNLLDSSITTGGCSEGSIRKVKRDANPSLDDITNLGGYKLFSSDGGSGPYAEPESTINAMGTRRYSFGIQCYEREQHMETMKEEPVIVYKRTPASVSRTSDICIGKKEMLMASSSDQMKGQIDASVRKSEMLFGKPSVSEGFKDERVLPLTYKRRKAQAKLNSFDFGKPLMAGIDLNSAIPKDLNQHSGESTKAVKIKFTVWKDTALNEER